MPRLKARLYIGPVVRTAARGAVRHIAVTSQSQSRHKKIRVTDCVVSDRHTVAPERSIKQAGVPIVTVKRAL
eukprot:scaffold4589_cov106-Isochrysis_galbana.AAC.4